MAADSEPVDKTGADLSRDRRAIAFRPLFVYRQQQITKTRLRDEAAADKAYHTHGGGGGGGSAEYDQQSHYDHSQCEQLQSSATENHHHHHHYHHHYHQDEAVSPY